MLVILASLLAVFAWGNDDFDVSVLQPFNEGIGIVGFIGKNRLDRIAINQRYGLRDIVSFTPRHPKAQRIAQPFGAGMEFAAKAASTAPESLR